MQQRSNMQFSSRESGQSNCSTIGFFSRSRQGFTLIELLVVIAIIAIIAAFLFPAFGAAEENSRQNNTMSHLHDIALGLGLYKLDNKSYPPVLFAYACDNAAHAVDQCSLSDSMQSIAADKNATNELVGLYPEYVRSYTSFEAEDDNLNDANGLLISSGTNNDPSNTGAVGSGPQPNYLCSDGSLRKANGGTYTLGAGGGTCEAPYRSFFLKDAMDVGPQVQATNQLTGGAGAYTYIVRYQTSWTSWNGSFDPAKTQGSGAASATYYGDGSPWNYYTRQLAWQNPPSDTYVTVVTSHIPNANKLIVLYASGSAIKKDLQLGSAPADWDEATSGSIAPVAETLSANCQWTQPSTSTVLSSCTYVPNQFWAINNSGLSH